MDAVFKIGSHDYTKYVAEGGLTHTRNDLDADGSGRNILNGTMYRSRIATKDTWEVTLMQVPEDVVKAINTDLDATYVSASFLDPKSNTVQTKTYYCSSITNPVKRSRNGVTLYDGLSFSLIER